MRTEKMMVEMELTRLRKELYDLEKQTKKDMEAIPVPQGHGCYYGGAIVLGLGLCYFRVTVIGIILILLGAFLAYDDYRKHKKWQDALASMDVNYQTRGKEVLDQIKRYEKLINDDERQKEVDVKNKD